MIVDIRRSAALSGFTRSGKARNAGQVGYGERFSAPQILLKLALTVSDNGKNTRFIASDFRKKRIFKQFIRVNWDFFRRLCEKYGGNLGMGTGGSGTIR